MKSFIETDISILLDDSPGLVTDHWGVLSSVWVMKLVKCLHNLREHLVSFLVQVRDSNPGSKKSIFWMLSSHGSGSFSGKVVQFNSCHSFVQTTDHFDSNGNLQREYLNLIDSSPILVLLDLRIPCSSRS